MLKIERPKYYKVKRGQTLKMLSRFFSCPERLIIAKNDLTEEIFEGQILSIPIEQGNLYTVKDGESKTLLSGDENAYEKKNGTSVLYPGMEIFI